MPRVARTQPPAAIAETFAVDAKTVRRWVKDGCPARRKGRSILLDEGEVAAWMKANRITGKPGRPAESDNEDLAGARLRKELALAERYELEVARQKGEVVPIADVRAKWGELVTVAKNKLIGIPAAAAGRCEGLDAPAIQKVLETLIADVLNGLARRA